MGAVAEAALATSAEYLAKIMPYLLTLHVECSEAFDARRVDNAATIGEEEHLAEGGGVGSRVVSIANLCRTDACIGNERVQQRALAYSTVAAQQGCSTFEKGSQLVDAFATTCANGQAFVVERTIECHNGFHASQFVRFKNVHLIEYQQDGDAVSFGRSKEAIDEGGARFGMCNGDQESRLVDIGSNDVALFREVRSLTDDVVAAVEYINNKCSLAIGAWRYLYPITNCHGVGATNALEAKVALHFTRKQLALVRLNDVPTACISNN